MPIRSLGVAHLTSFWSRHRGGPPDPSEWVRDNTLLAGLRIGLRETFDYLLQNKPSLEEFEAWIVDRNGGAIETDRLDRLNDALSDAGAIGQPADPAAAPALSGADLDVWDERGYVVLHDAVPQENCRAAVQAICDFVGADLAHPDTWYGGLQGHSIWIPLLHHPTLHANRTSARIHRAFAQLWNREDIWINVDQAGMNPPSGRTGGFRALTSTGTSAWRGRFRSGCRGFSTSPTPRRIRARLRACPVFTAGSTPGSTACPMVTIRGRTISRQPRCRSPDVPAIW